MPENCWAPAAAKRCDPRGQPTRLTVLWAFAPNFLTFPLPGLTLCTARKGSVPVENKKSFGEYIRRKRQDAGLTQRELADRLYVTESTVSKWERGLSYPDVSLIPEVCRQLSISEHEFFTACDDDKAHARERSAAAWERLKRGWWWVSTVSYAVAIVVCFLCDLAIFHRLDWFWIVLTALMLAFSLTDLPLLLRRDRLSISMAAATGSLALLLLACRLYTGGRWVLAGLGITAACLLLPWGLWALWRFYGRHLPVVCLGWMTGWTFLLLAVIRLFTGGSWLLPLALPIAGFSWAVVWAYFAVIRWLPAGGLIKGGLCALFSALLLPGANAFAMLLTDQPVHPRPEVYFQWGRLFQMENYDWINVLTFLCLLALAAALLIAGAVRAARRKP